MSKRDLEQLARELMDDQSLPADLKAVALRGTMAARAILAELGAEPLPACAETANEA
ncbi:MAG: hypothetical protein J7521_21015 [Caulobacter sp.]|nr:hypothetical protein [Caulobacter sp.]